MKMLYIILHIYYITYIIYYIYIILHTWYHASEIKNKSWFVPATVTWGKI